MADAVAGLSEMLSVGIETNLEAMIHLAGMLIDGKAVAAELRSEVKRDVEAFREKYGIEPGLAVVLVGEDPASQVYVRMKERACSEVGIRSERHDLPADTGAEEILQLVLRLAEDETVHGILVQLPLPEGVDPAPIIEAIPPQKDVDGFHPRNMGALLTGTEGLLPCTPAGVLELIRRTGVDLNGKRAVVLGRSNIVGKPASILLLAENATVVMCHSRTENLEDEVRNADILVVATGQPEMVKGDWIKPGVVVIDVGIHRMPDGKIVGDVEFESAREKAGFITPVPGGVGPMTVAMLLKNTLLAAEMQIAAR